MRRTVLAALAAGGFALPLIDGTGFALADDDRDRGSASRSIGTGSSTTAPPFELEIDPELDAQFPDRPVKGGQAADIVTERLGGGRVTEVELEEDGRPYWEVKADFQGGEVELAVDAFTGDIVGDGDDSDRGGDDRGGDRARDDFGGDDFGGDDSGGRDDGDD
jgi:uncharacterized membrane protein YkoI